MRESAPCGTAVHLREPVTVTDICTDPFWDYFRDLARRGPHRPDGLRGRDRPSMPDRAGPGPADQICSAPRRSRYARPEPTATAGSPGACRFPTALRCRSASPGGVDADARRPQRRGAVPLRGRSPGLGRRGRIRNACPWLAIATRSGCRPAHTRSRGSPLDCDPIVHDNASAHAGRQRQIQHQTHLSPLIPQPCILPFRQPRARRVSRLA